MKRDFAGREILSLAQQTVKRWTTTSSLIPDGGFWRRKASSSLWYPVGEEVKLRACEGVSVQESEHRPYQERDTFHACLLQDDITINSPQDVFAVGLRL